MSFRVRITLAAKRDLSRLHDFQLERDPALAQRALDTIEKALLLLRDFPHSCRKASADNAFIRELIIPFGSSGYVALFEIEDAHTVTILAVRHQLEDDYH